MSKTLLFVDDEKQILKAIRNYTLIVIIVFIQQIAEKKRLKYWIIQKLT